MSLFRLEVIRREMASIGRFVVVGVCNTLIGYSIILVALAGGMGDYLANATGFALGLPIAYGLHRVWTFRAPGKATVAEALRYAFGVAVAFSANLAVVALGRSMGLVGNAAVQLVAVCVYAGVFYLISRIIVFGSCGPERNYRNSVGSR